MPKYAGPLRTSDHTINVPRVQSFALEGGQSPQGASRLALSRAVLRQAVHPRSHTWQWGTRCIVTFKLCTFVPFGCLFVAVLVVAICRFMVQSSTLACFYLNEKPRAL